MILNGLNRIQRRSTLCHCVQDTHKNCLVAMWSGLSRQLFPASYKKPQQVDENFNRQHNLIPVILKMSNSGINQLSITSIPMSRQMLRPINTSYAPIVKSKTLKDKCNRNKRVTFEEAGLHWDLSDPINVTLPDLVITRIMYYLPYRSAVRLERVCRRWRRLSRSANVNDIRQLVIQSCAAQSSACVNVLRPLHRLHLHLPIALAPAYVMLDGMITKHATYITHLTVTWHVLKHINSMVDCMGASDGVKALFPNVRHLSCTVYCGDNDNDKKLNTARRWFHKLNHIHWQIHGSTNESLNDVSHMHVWLHDTFVFATCSVEIHIADERNLLLLLRAYKQTPITMLKIINSSDQLYTTIDLCKLASILTSPIYQLSVRGLRLPQLDCTEWPQILQTVNYFRCSSTQIDMSVMDIFSTNVLRRWEVYGETCLVNQLFTDAYPDVWRQFPKLSIEFSTPDGIIFSC